MFLFFFSLNKILIFLLVLNLLKTFQTKKDLSQVGMISTFQCRESNQQLTVLDYNEGKTNGRYRAVINDAQLAVLHLQRVDTEDTLPDVSQLYLCPGVLESEVLPLLSQSLSNPLACSMFLIEKVEDQFMYRWESL